MMICAKCGSDDVVRAGAGNVYPTGTPICRGDCHGPTAVADDSPSEESMAATEEESTAATEQATPTPAPGFMSRLMGASQETEE
jgi:hypothetical protein